MAIERIYNGIWRLKVGEGFDTLLELSGTMPKESKLEECEPTFSAQSILVSREADRHVVSIPFSSDEKLYGLGLSFQSICKNYEAVPLRADHFGGKDNGRTHVPAPFYVSSRGYGIFVDTTAFPTFYMGGAVRKDAKYPPAEKDRGSDADWSAVTPSEYVEVSFSGKGANVYLITGRNLKDVVSRFNMLCGGGCAVPKWGLGFWERLHIRSEEKDVYDTLESYEKRGFALDVLGLEPGWQSNSYPCSFEISRKKYPEFEKMTEELSRRGVRLNLWENMYISRRSPIYEKMYDYSGSHMVWNGIVPDYTLKEARDIYSEYHKRTLLELGVSGFKIDECDGYDKYLWPDHASFPSGRDAATLRQSYGLLCQRTVYEMFKEQNKRTYGLVRASNAGASSFPFCVYNDCYTFSDFLNGICSAAFCGTLWVPEVRDAKSADEWVRRFQLCALSPMMMLNSWATGAKPWKFPEVENIIRGLIDLRRSLMPYLYNAFHTYAEEGIPPFRPICMDFGAAGSEERGSGALDDTDNPYEHKELGEITDQFMVGEYLMVAPVLPGKTQREVVLPADCDWYDFFTGEYVGRGEKKVFDCPLENMLVFVRAGGMIPMLGTENKLTVRCFGDAGESFIYDDDGESFNFERGEYSLRTVAFKREGEKLIAEIRTVCDAYKSDYDISFE